MARSEALALVREQRKAAMDARLAAIVTDPQILGLATLLGGVYLAQRIPWAEDEGRNDMLRGVATTGVVLMALNRAGFGGWPAAAVAGVAGAATIESEKPFLSGPLVDWVKGIFS
jgi:hypothetical protein